MIFGMRMRTVVLGLNASLVWLLCASGCGGDDTEGANGSACVPGRSVACTGASACEGSQVCLADGSGYGSCECANGTGGDTSGSGGANSSGGDVGSGGNAETGGNTGTGGDTGGSATGGSAAGGAGNCEPVDMSDWEAPAYVPARTQSSACTEELVEQYFENDCQAGGCEEFEDGGEHEACGTCLAPSALDDSERGPVLTFRENSVSSFETNAAGCVELMGDEDCAAKLQALDDCTREACRASCEITDSASHAAYSTCREEARTGECAEQQAAAICLSNDAATACGGKPGDLFVSLGKVFCATP